MWTEAAAATRTEAAAATRTEAAALARAAARAREWIDAIEEGLGVSDVGDQDRPLGD